MPANLKDIIDFIQTYCHGRELYWEIPRGQDNFAIIWSPRGQPGWQIGGRHTVRNTPILKSEEFIAHLESAGANLEICTQRLGTTAISQAVFADLMLNAAKKLFGPSAIETGVQETAQFLDAITRSLREQALQNPPAQNSPPDTASRHRPTLRVVKS